jgi:hypothetical protein
MKARIMRGMAHRIHACRDRAIHPGRNGDGRYVGSGIDYVTHDIPPRRFPRRARETQRTDNKRWCGKGLHSATDHSDQAAKYLPTLQSYTPAAGEATQSCELWVKTGTAPTG